MRLVRVAAATYDHAITARPILTKSCTGGGLAFLADLHAQVLESRRLTAAAESNGPLCLDIRRSFAFTSMSFLWTGPVNHNWYNFAERVFPQAGGLRNALAKTAVSQLFVNPCLYLPYFYTYTGVIFNRSVNESLTKMRAEYWDALRGCWATLGVTNIFMFTFIPVAYQASAIAVATFCFNVILSLISNRDRLQANRERLLDGMS